MYKKILALLTAVALLVTVFPAAAVQAAGNTELSVLSKPQVMEEEKAVSPFTIDANDEKVAESDSLILYLNKDALILKVEIKETGYIFCSTVPADKSEGMSMEWIRMSQSLLTMDFISNGSIKRSPLKHGEAKKPQITEIENGFEATVNFYEAKASLALRVVLEDNTLTLSIPDESIELEDGNLVNKILVMPFFGAAYQDTIPGYAFVPDGSGALMRYDKARPYTTMYSQRVYGRDRAVSQPVAESASQVEAELLGIRMPVFGMVHGSGQNAFVGIVNGGDEYCELMANPAGNIVDYTWMCPALIYNEQYWQPTGRASGFYGTQPRQNHVDLEVEYQFLSGEQADYVGMANAYRQKLLEENPALTPVEGTEIGLKLDAFMAEPKKALIGNSLKVMTTARDVSDWVTRLQESGITELSVSLVGYEKGGKNGHTMKGYSLDRKAAKRNELVSLDEQLGGRLFLQSTVSSGYEEQLGKSQRKSSMNGGIIQKAEDQPLFTNRVWATEESVEREILSYIKDAPVSGLALEDFGSELNGDYQRKESTLRGEVLDLRQELLLKMEESGRKISLGDPGFYVFGQADVESVFHIPTNNSCYSYFTDTVPFLQIVLSGYVEMYSTYQNFNSNSMEDILRLIDYNVYPSYLLTEASASELANSNMSYLYSSRFDTWEEDIVEHYGKVNEILSKVKGAGIVRRTVPAAGVSVTEYENGVTVAVNYTDEEVTVNGVNVPGMAAVIL